MTDLTNPTANKQTPANNSGYSEPPLILTTQPKSNSRTKLIAIGIVTLFFLTSIPLAIFLAQNRQDIRQRAEFECGDRSEGECWGECYGADEHNICCEGGSKVDKGTATANSPTCSTVKACGDREEGECWGECKGSDEHNICCEGGNKVDKGTVTANAPNCTSTKACGDRDLNDCWTECVGGDLVRVCCTGNQTRSRENLQYNSPQCEQYETTRNASQVCQEEGTVTSTCIADPRCTMNGGVCCNTISNINKCCYGDSQTRRDGACYAGGQQTDVTCSGATMTNNRNTSIQVLKFGGGSTCDPSNFNSPSGEITLGPGQSVTAHCEQLDARGACGVCDDNCGSPNEPTPPDTATCNQACSSSTTCSSGLSCISGVCRNSQCSTETDCLCPTTPTTYDCQCTSVKVYRAGVLIEADQIKLNDTVKFVGYGWSEDETDPIDLIEIKVIRNNTAIETQQLTAVADPSQKVGARKYFKAELPNLKIDQVGNYSVQVLVHTAKRNWVGK